MATEYIIVNGEAMELMEDGRFPVYYHYPEGSTMFDASCCPPRLVPVEGEGDDKGVTLLRLIPHAPYFVYTVAGPNDRIEARRIIDAVTQEISQTSNLVHTKVNAASPATSSSLAYPNDNVYNVIPSLMQVFPSLRHAFIERKMDYLCRIATAVRYAGDGSTMPSMTNLRNVHILRDTLERIDQRVLYRYIIAHGLEPNTTAEDIGKYFEEKHNQYVYQANACSFGSQAPKPCRSVGYVEVREIVDGTFKLLMDRYLPFQNSYMYVVGSDRKPIEEPRLEPFPTSVGPAPVREHAEHRPRQHHNPHPHNRADFNDRHPNDRHHMNHFNPRMNGPMGGGFNRGPPRGTMHGGHIDRHNSYNGPAHNPNMVPAGGAFRDTRESRAEPMLNSMSSQNNTPTNALNVPLPRSATQQQGGPAQPSFHNNGNSVIYCVGHISEEITESSVQDGIFIPSTRGFDTIAKLAADYGTVYLFVIYHHQPSMIFGLARVSAKCNNSSFFVQWIAPHRNIAPAMVPDGILQQLGLGPLSPANWFDGIRIAESVDGSPTNTSNKGNLLACQRLHEFLEACPLRPSDSPTGSPSYGNRGIRRV